MAFGLLPKHVRELSLDDLTAKQFIVLASEAAKKLGWNVGYTSDTGVTAFTNFSLSSWSEQVKVKIDGATAVLSSECTGSQITDWGKNKRNINDLITTINDLKITLPQEEVEQKIKEQEMSYVFGDDPRPVLSGERKSFLDFAKPSEGYFITPILIYLNAAVFIVMVISGVDFFSPDGESLVRWGANFRPATMEGEWWRLITCCFLHIGVFHLLMNMYALLYIGTLLEPHLGRLRFLSAYLLTGLAASVASLWWHDFTVSAGASGAIFGLYGVFLAMLTTSLIEQSARNALLTSILVFIGYNLVSGLKGEVDNAAHIGGLVSGIIIGYAFMPSLKEPDLKNLEYSSVIMISVVVLFCAAIVCKIIPNNIGEYERKMEEFTSTQAMALEVYNLPETTPKEDLLRELKHRGIYYWNDNINLLNELEKMDLPEVLHERNKELIRYCNLRIKTYRLMYRKIEEDTQIYNDSIDIYNRQIESLVAALSNKKEE